MDQRPPVLIPLLDLEQWREAEGLSYAELAARIGAGDATRARKWALGIERPSALAEDRILAVTGHRVGLYPMHQRRVAFLQSRERGMRIAGE